MKIDDKDFGRLGPIPTGVLVDELCEIELKLDELLEKKKLIRYELLHRYKTKRLKGLRFNGR